MPSSGSSEFPRLDDIQFLAASSAPLYGCNIISSERQRQHHHHRRRQRHYWHIYMVFNIRFVCLWMNGYSAQRGSQLRGGGEAEQSFISALI